VRDWQCALLLTSSFRRIGLFLDLALGGFIPRDEWSRLLPDAISMGDAPRHDRDRLIVVLTVLRERNELAFDGDAAREAYATLPDQVTIYRGTIVAEVDSGEIGVCWTLDPDRARWFATEHGRCRNSASPPVMLSATVAAWRFPRAAFRASGK
jgi:hypothetical protein